MRVLLGLVALVLMATPASSHHGHIFQRVAQSTVYINTSDGKGSGFYVGNKTVITAGHVCGENPVDEIAITAQDKEAVIAEGVLRNMEKDYCIILLTEDFKNIPPLGFATKLADVGDVVFHFGYPVIVNLFKFDPREETSRQVITGTLVETPPIEIIDPNGFYLWSGIVGKGALFPGMSGGPVVNVHGAVVGITVGADIVKRHTVFVPNEVFLDDMYSVQGL